jgi:hypothetical protein
VPPGSLPSNHIIGTLAVQEVLGTSADFDLRNFEVLKLYQKHQVALHALEHILKE